MRVKVSLAMISPLASISKISITEKTVNFKPQKLNCHVENDCVGSGQRADISEQQTQVKILLLDMFFHC